MSKRIKLDEAIVDSFRHTRMTRAGLLDLINLHAEAMADKWRRLKEQYPDVKNWDFSSIDYQTKELVLPCEEEDKKKPKP